MALIKSIKLSNGVIVNYHRIVSVQNITNHASIIEIASYPSKEKRLEEIEALKNKQMMDVFIESDYITTNYNKDLNVDSAYDYVKTLEKYENAQDD
jgi:hypothetical protein